MDYSCSKEVVSNNYVQLHFSYILVLNNEVIIQLLFVSSDYSILDVDECLLDLHNCPTNFVCEDEVGSFQCVCDTRFSGSDCSKLFVIPSL